MRLEKAQNNYDFDGENFVDEVEELEEDEELEEEEE